MYPVYPTSVQSAAGSTGELGPHALDSDIRNPSQFAKNVAEFKDSMYTGSFAAGARGLKYGVHSSKANYRSFVFRRNSYGQFRDMLEMGGNGALWDSATATTVFAVESAFRDRDGSVVSPESTSCSNLDAYSSSSAPFFDRDAESDNLTDQLVVRNRGTFASEFLDLEVDDLS